MNRTERTVLCAVIALAAVFLLIVHVVRNSGGGDNGLFYYATKLALHGSSPYDTNRLRMAWERDGSPAALPPHRAFSGFDYPASIAALYAPAAIFTPRFAVVAIVVLNVIAGIACILLLGRSTIARWDRETKMLAVAGALLAPAFLAVIRLGQPTLIICALVAGAVAAFRMRRDLLGGLLIGLSLSKFTLTLPLLLYLAYRRNARATLAAIATFAVVNVVLLAPTGIVSSLHEYARTVAVDARPNGPFDPSGTDETIRASAIVSAQRAIFLISGGNRTVAGTGAVVLAVGIAIALAIVLKPKRRTEALFSNPLEAPLLVLAGLTLFYHRTYDLAALIIVAAGLIDYGLRWPRRRKSEWIASVSILATVICFGSESALTHLVNGASRELGLGRITDWLCLVLLASIVTVLGIAFRDRRLPNLVLIDTSMLRSEPIPADGATKIAA